MTMVIYSGNGDANKNGHDGIVNDDESNKDNAHFQCQWNDQDKTSTNFVSSPWIDKNILCQCYFKVKRNRDI